MGSGHQNKRNLKREERAPKRPEHALAFSGGPRGCELHLPSFAVLINARHRRRRRRLLLITTETGKTRLLLVMRMDWMLMIGLSIPIDVQRYGLEELRLRLFGPLLNCRVAFHLLGLVHKIVIIIICVWGGTAVAEMHTIFYLLI